MALATIGGYTFKINPHTASWTYNLNTFSQDTYGGRVVQILSRSIEGLSISGYLSVKRSGEYQWTEMESFEKTILDIMDYHESQKKPVLFRFPPLSWEGNVYITKYSDVKYDRTTSVVEYTLVMEVEDGFGDVRFSPTDQGLLAIPDGVNWERNVYNSPSVSQTTEALSKLKEMLEDQEVYSSGQKKFVDYLTEVQGSEEPTNTSKVQITDSMSNYASLIADRFSNKKPKLAPDLSKE